MNLRDLKRFPSGCFSLRQRRGHERRCPLRSIQPSQGQRPSRRKSRLTMDPHPVTGANEYATGVPQPGGVCGIRNVSRATLTPVLPNSGAGDGAAVSRQEVPSLACSLAIDLEGFRVAHALADHRVTAFVLKYVCILVQQRATTLTGSPRTWSINTLPIRTRAWPCNTGPRSRMAFERSPWSAETAVNRIVDPKRVGVIGFSAGALTARSTKRRF